MIQILAKLRFIERYCNPREGWKVFVDIDPSEEGRTGTKRESGEAIARQQFTLGQAPKARRQMEEDLGAFVGKRKKQWRTQFKDKLKLPPGDRDILAVHPDRRILWVTEVEGDSSGQPEGKIYKALGQLICAISEMQLPDYTSHFSLVVSGEEMAAHLRKAHAVERLGVSGLIISENRKDDEWLFRESDLNSVV